MSENNRLLITKLVLRPDNRVDLIARGHRFKDTTLFEASDLLEVGIDPSTLQVGVETPCRFYAHCTISEKRNKAGNAYLDVEYLEAVGSNGAASQPAGALTEAILEELRAIRAELEHQSRLLAAARTPVQVATGPEPADLPEMEALDEPPIDDASPESGPSPRPQPLNDAQARREFGAMAGPAIRAGLVANNQVNELTKAATVIGWRDALQKLNDLVEQSKAQAEQPETVAA